jgi:hypothetical protein
MSNVPKVATIGSPYLSALVCSDVSSFLFLGRVEVVLSYRILQVTSNLEDPWAGWAAICPTKAPVRF